MVAIRILVGVVLVVLFVASDAAAIEAPCVVDPTFPGQCEAASATVCANDGDCPAGDRCLSVQVCAYTGLGAFGDNLTYDADFSRCTLDQGCIDIAGNPCAPEGTCFLKPVPPGRCSAGTNSDCVWPGGGGRCSTTTNFACLTNSDCPSGETCDLSTNNPLCECTNELGSKCEIARTPCVDAGECPGGEACLSTNQTDVCGGSQARCSDGDTPEGAFGTGLCIDLNLGEEAITNCGEEAGQPLNGPRWQVENPGQPITPQRAPGSGFPASGPIVDIEGGTAIAITEPDSFGVRRMRAFGDSLHAPWTYGSRKVSGGLVDAHIITNAYDAPFGWEPVQPVQGNCVGNPALLCTKDADCPGADTCDPATFVYAHETAVAGPFFLWTQDVDPGDPNLPDVDGNGEPDCPPLCGINLAVNTLQESAIRNAGLMDSNVGIQASLDVLVDGPAGTGDVVGVTRVISLTWLPVQDMRCFIGGDQGRANPSDTKIGRCAFTPFACDPATEKTNLNPGGTTDDCGGGNEQCFYCNGDFFTTPRPRNDPLPDLPPNPEALPIGYNAHGLAGLDIHGQLGGIGGTGYSVRVPLFILASSGDQSLEFRDTDRKATEDLRTIGPVSGAQNGLGAGFCLNQESTSCTITVNACVFGRCSEDNSACVTGDDCPIVDDCPAGQGPCVGGVFRNGTVIPATGQMCCAGGSDIVIPVEAAGTPDAGICELGRVACSPVGSACPDFDGQADTCLPALSITSIIGPGPNGIPGCVGDNDPESETDDDPFCASPLGITDPNELALLLGDPNACIDPVTAPSDPRCNTGFDDTMSRATIDGQVIPAVISRRKSINPLAPAPTFSWVAVGSAPDLSVLGVFNTDAHFKVDTLSCPLVDGDSACCLNLTDPECNFGPVVDQDGDGVPDGSDNCVSTKNAGQTNSDADSMGDACDYCRNVDLTAGTQHQDDDGDGVGNVCDIDFDQSGFGNVTDLIRFLDTFGKNTSDNTCPDAAGNPVGSCAVYDVTAEGPVINVSDLLVVIGPLFGQPISNHNCAPDDDAVVQCP
jgi:hypothetical protein